MKLSLNRFRLPVIGNSFADLVTGVGPYVKRDLRSRVVACALALGCVLTAFSIRSLLTPIIGERAPLMLFALAAMVSGWYGGLGIGLLTMLVGGALGDYFFVPPYRSIGSFGVAECTETLEYSVVTAASLAILEGLRRAQLRAEKSTQLAQNQGAQLRDSLREIGEAAGLTLAHRVRQIFRLRIRLVLLPMRPGWVRIREQPARRWRADKD